ncbi:MAG: VPLPA-CTERM sorting domain-containing protein [Desulfobacterium sp.]|nr:VPLPA-CTERM sorting domain-containing protein [Desulfobacterium sp.]
MNSGDWAVVKFDHKIMDDAANPYGQDLLVFGNAFFPGSGFVADNTNHDEYTLNGGIFSEGVTVSVSQNGTDWYKYENGPTGDGLYPTNPWVWNSELFKTTGNGWTDKQNDFTKPVDPSVTADDFKGLTSAQAMALYNGSAGGTGFDLAESGFEWIQYVKVEGAGGEVDAFADVSAAAPVPVPAAIWLLGSGLAGIIGLRRRSNGA